MKNIIKAENKRHFNKKNVLDTQSSLSVSRKIL